jgi:hypothetical protein
MRRYRKRPFPSGAEPETQDPVPVRTNAVETARPLASKDSSTPYFEQLFDDAKEAARQAEERPVFNVVKPSRPL